MSGKASRAKGVRGQSQAANLLRDRDWIVDQITAGIGSHDFTATDTARKTWAVEVKNCAGIIPAHKRQAIEQAKARRLPWMLMSKISGSSSWLIQRQSAVPAIWHEKEDTFSMGKLEASGAAGSSTAARPPISTEERKVVNEN